MRPQQNRRMRGRGNNNNNNNNQNRKGPNPLTRSYESNGPDVKIRGSAQQIAEKYATLARDAQSAGDRVMAENYLQHAEHYNRIIMAAQAQFAQQQVREVREDDDQDEDGDELSPFTGDRSGQQQRGNDRSERNNERGERNNGTGPQPVIEGTPAEVALEQGTINNGPANGAEQPASAEAGEGEAAPRRARRPRRPRGGKSEDASNEAQASDSDEAVTEAAQ